MIEVWRSEDRGKADHGWLLSRHTFSFADYHDPERMGFRDLRVINEDRVQPLQGFGTHGNSDLAIVSYVLEGALEHRDSLGNGSTIRPGDVQVMSAGTGVRHSEFNPSGSALVHFLQIWILPNAGGLRPSYGQESFASELERGGLVLVASPDGRDGSLTIHQDVKLYAARLAAGGKVGFELSRGRAGWVQVARGDVQVGKERLFPGDAAVVEDERAVAIQAASPAEILLFDLG